MSFSVEGEDEDFEFAGTPRGLFCQPREPRAAGLLADDRRSAALQPRAARAARRARRADERSLARFVSEGGYSRWFVERLIVPQASAVWSADPRGHVELPGRASSRSSSPTTACSASATGRAGRPSSAARSAMSRRSARRSRDRVRLGTPVVALTSRRTRRHAAQPRAASSERFDQVIIACHADQALAMLAGRHTGRARAARRVPLPAQRGGAAHRRERSCPPPRAPARPGTTTCCASRGR